MRAGLLTETIQILRPVVEKNAVGEQVTTYVEKMTIRARNVVHREAQTNLNGDISYPKTYTLEVRIFQPVDDYDRIRWNGKDYTITIIEIDRPLMCKRLEITEVNE